MHWTNPENTGTGLEHRIRGRHDVLLRFCTTSCAALFRQIQLNFLQGIRRKCLLGFGKIVKPEREEPAGGSRSLQSYLPWPSHVVHFRSVHRARLMSENHLGQPPPSNICISKNAYGQMKRRRYLCTCSRPSYGIKQSS